MISVAPRRRVAGWVIAVAVTMAVLPLFGQDFYEQQLRAGKEDRAAGKLVEAADELRIASFGFLDRPLLLSESLANLALVQQALGYPAVAQTVDRFVDVERRFASWVPSATDQPTRAAFEQLLVSTQRKSDLATIPSLARLTRSDAQKVADLPPMKRAAAYDEGARKNPRDVEWPLAAAMDATSRGLNDDAIRWSRRALNIDRDNDAARGILAHALTRGSQCREALNLISRMKPETVNVDLAGDQLVCLVNEKHWTEAQTLASKLPENVRQRADVARALQSINATVKPTTMTSGSVDPRLPVVVSKTPTQPVAPQPARPAMDPQKVAQAVATSKTYVQAGRFTEAVDVLKPAVAADPGNREVRLALLEAAMLSHDWRTAAAQVDVAAPFTAGEEASMFYAAATLYENGRRDEARALIERARPRLNGTPMIDYYYDRIVGRR
jgi:tetratricopeptide (TPR) repeat protein